MNMVIASDSFKGSLSSERANQIIEQAAQSVFPLCKCNKLMIADGGEGTLEAILGESNRNEYEIISVSVLGPRREITEAYYLKKAETAIIEMAQASGLPLLMESERNPLLSTSIGTGQLIRHALERGANNIYIGIGGSATNDGGIGAMHALGVRFLDEHGEILEPIGQNLIRIRAIDDSNMLAEFACADITIMCDVTNPLTGSNGATCVYAAQKGADQEMIKYLECGMKNYQQVLQEYHHKKQKNCEDICEIAGLGAAGGLGAALYVFGNAKMKSGIDIILDINNFDQLLDQTDLVITGEGKTDEQSVNGKVIAGIAKRCSRKNVPLYVISGSLDGQLDELYDIGVSGLEACVCNITDLDQAIADSEKNLSSAAKRVFHIINSARLIDKKIKD